ncbi:GNAT family N-acetyltransferase [Dyadobacter sp. 32]|uniref:GNAT family N-acetyltransferase n=1 Tax=Dyadobacter sp. 32 TaxID=538966 RepID=UPI0011ECF4BA
MIKLRNATIDDLAVLQYWDEQPHNIASDPNDDWEWETELLHNPVWRQQLMAELNGRPIGFVQIIDPFLEESHYWGEVAENLRAIDIWIGESGDLARGHGSVMMRQALELCFSRKEVDAVIIDPLKNNVRARRFYERLGFRFIENRTFGLDQCAVYRLERSDWQADTLSDSISNEGEGCPS